jgi:undecaprenyl-diphosphatase
MFDKLIALDTKIFLWLNALHSPGWDKIMWHISGKIEWLPLYLFLFGYIVYRYKWRSLAILLTLALAITLADQLAVLAFKETIRRLRPTHEPAIAHLVHTVNNYRGGAYGFVSNHAANSFALACYLSLLFRNKLLTVLLILWACLVSYSRIYLGVHYPGDIIGGAILGSIIGWVFYLLYSKTEKYITPKRVTWNKIHNGNKNESLR